MTPANAASVAGQRAGLTPVERGAARDGAQADAERGGDGQPPGVDVNHRSPLSAAGDQTLVAAVSCA